MVFALRILIFGAGGFVGRHLAVAMARNGHEVVALVRRTWPGSLAQQKAIRIERADLATADTLPPGPFDALLHCAAAIPANASDAAELVRINVEVPVNAADKCDLHNGCDPARRPSAIWSRGVSSSRPTWRSPSLSMKPGVICRDSKPTIFFPDHCGGFGGPVEPGETDERCSPATGGVAGA